MKYIRKAPVREEAQQPKSEPVKAVEPDITPALASLVQSNERVVDALERVARPTTEIAPAAPRPTAFTVTVTERDAKGRAVKFDIEPKSDKPAADEFESGFQRQTS